MIKRIIELCDARGWTIYRLAKESDITYSTLSTLINKVNMPSMSTLSKLCHGFNITLSQFFDTNNCDKRLSDKEKKHLDRWNALTDGNQNKIDDYIDYLLTKQ